MATVTKKELTDRVADSVKLKRVVVRDVVQRFLDEMVAELSKGNRLEFRDFGVFEVRIRKPRMARNPRTNERVAVDGKGTVKFKIGRLMRDAVQANMPGGRSSKTDRSASSIAAQSPPPPA